MASVEAAILALPEALGRQSVGWKVGAASPEIRAAENLPGPAPGLIFEGSLHQSPAVLGRDDFINYRLCECEFVFALERDFVPRPSAYTPAEVRRGVASFSPAIEVGDSVFPDWYALSAFYGALYDNNGGSALVTGASHTYGSDTDLAVAEVVLTLNGQSVRKGSGSAAMGDPLTSLTWMLNWLSQHGITAAAGECVSTGTLTGHCFVAPGDQVVADFGQYGRVEACFA